MLRFTTRVRPQGPFRKGLVGRLASPRAQSTISDATMMGSGDQFWRHLAPYKDVSPEEFMSWGWQSQHSLVGNLLKQEKMVQKDLVPFLRRILPDRIPPPSIPDPHTERLTTRELLIKDMLMGLHCAQMTMRIPPYMISRIDWNRPLDDPIFAQFVPLLSRMKSDHPQTGLDSLDERADTPAENLVHRYPHKVLFIVVNWCPVGCQYCTRSYVVGPDTDLVDKDDFEPNRQSGYDYISHREEINDVVVSGGDTYQMSPRALREVGFKLLDIPHVRYVRFATRGLAAAPSRVLDPNDKWTRALTDVANHARKLRKEIFLHTHINHPNELSWITREAVQRLADARIKVRNQAVLLRGVNDSFEAQYQLARQTSDMGIEPYKVYMCDMVPRTEHFRVPLHEAQDLCQRLMGKMSGFNMPEFTMDLPGGGGKRNIFMHDEYDRATGVSKWRAPEVKPGQEFAYYDPDPVPTPLKDNLTDVQLKVAHLTVDKDMADTGTSKSSLLTSHAKGEAGIHVPEAEVTALTRDGAQTEKSATPRKTRAIHVPFDSSNPTQYPKSI